MALREIITVPNKVLTTKARPITSFNRELQILIDDMIDTMRAAPGVGLAAPQVNIPSRVIVVEYGEEQPEGKPEKPPKLYSVVNPEITRFSSDMEMGTEGCLSIPGFVGDVERYTSVTVKGFNRQGQPVRIKASGWLARIFQHEINHLDGILFTDLAERVYKFEEAEEPDIIAAD